MNMWDPQFLRRGDDQDDLQEVWQTLAELDCHTMTGLVV